MSKESINFELYKIFYYAAVCGNITTAAKKLYLSQPSVTKHIHALEEALGCVLFYRSSRGIVLTQEGQALMRKIEPACKLIFSAEQEIESLQALEQGLVTLASTEMGYQTYFLPAITEFQKKHPNIKFNFTSVLNEEANMLLFNDMIDMAVLHEPFKREPYMNVQVIEHMTEYMVCGKKYADFAQKERTPEELKQLPFISMPKGSAGKQYLSNYFYDFGLDFEPEIELTSVNLTMLSVEYGLGIGMLPKQIALPEIRKGNLFRIHLKNPLPKRYVCLVTNKNTPQSITASEFINVLLSKN